MEKLFRNGNDFFLFQNSLLQIKKSKHSLRMFGFFCYSIKRTVFDYCTPNFLRVSMSKRPCGRLLSFWNLTKAALV